MRILRMRACTAAFTLQKFNEMSGNTMTFGTAAADFSLNADGVYFPRAWQLKTCNCMNTVLGLIGMANQVQIPVFIADD